MSRNGTQTVPGIVRIIIADDHAIVRQGLKKVLLEHSDLRIVGEASSGLEALDLVRSVPADVLLLDITMPGKGGLEVIKDVKAMNPRISIIVLSMHPEDQFAVRVLRSGGSAYVAKETAPEELVRAIRKTALGRRYVSEALAERLATMTEVEFEKTPHERLSDREFEVLRMIASGETLSGIARHLSLSVKTVSTYRARILDKLRLGSNAEVARYAVEHHLIE